MKQTIKTIKICLKKYKLTPKNYIIQIFIKISKQYNIKCCAPQGSILGQLLLLLYANDSLTTVLHERK